MSKEEEEEEQEDEEEEKEREGRRGLSEGGGRGLEEEEEEKRESVRTTTVSSEAQPPYSEPLTRQKSTKGSTISQQQHTGPRALRTFQLWGQESLVTCGLSNALPIPASAISSSHKSTSVNLQSGTHLPTMQMRHLSFRHMKSLTESRRAAPQGSSTLSCQGGGRNFQYDYITVHVEINLIHLIFLMIGINSPVYFCISYCLHLTVVAPGHM